MGVTTPSITVQTAEALRQRQVEDARLQKLKDDALARIRQQYGDFTDQILNQESAQKGLDADTLADIRQVNNADAYLRRQEGERADYEGRLQQGTADRSSEAARAFAAAADERIAKIRGDVTAKFAGFNDPFYTDYASKYLDARLPSVRDLYNEKFRKLQLSLGQRGVAESSAAARKYKELTQAQINEESGIASSAYDSANTLRAQNEAQRNRTQDLGVQNATLTPFVAPQGGNTADQNAANPPPQITVPHRPRGGQDDSRRVPRENATGNAAVPGAPGNNPTATDNAGASFNNLTTPTVKPPPNPAAEAPEFDIDEYLRRFNIPGISVY